MTTCQYDSGSMYDCRPVCDRPAHRSFQYRNGTLGPFTVALCSRHMTPMAGRVYPSTLTLVGSENNG